MALTQVPIELSSTPGIVDNSNTTALTIDSSSRLGIGTTSPSNDLHIKGAGAATIRLEQGNGVNYALIKQNQTSQLLQLGVGGSFGININSSNQVGIGTSTPQEPLSVQSSGQRKILATNTDFASGTTGSSFDIGFGATSGNTYTDLRALINGRSAWGDLVLQRGGGNLLVGTTNSSLVNSTTGGGVNILSDGLTTIARQTATASDTVFVVNDTGAGGSLQVFRENGATVGSIRSVAGQDIIIGSGSAGLRFLSSGPALQPRNSNGNANNDAIDIGLSGNRFKDLYLSGGAYLGGTGSANKLDDYEVGTFTPTANAYSGVMSVNEAVYRKIGDLVMVRVAVAFDGTTDGSAVILNGLPFSSNSSGSGGFVSDDGSGSATSVRYQAATSMAVTDGQNAVTYTTVGANSIKLTYFYIAT